MLAGGVSFGDLIAEAVGEEFAEGEPVGDRLNAATGPHEVVDLVQDLSPRSAGDWLDRVAGFGAPAVLALLRAVRRARDSVDYLYEMTKSRVVMALVRLETDGVPGLVELYYETDPATRSRICVALGRPGASEHKDLVCQHLQAYPVGGGPTHYIGPLWALSDLGDPRLASVLLDALSQGYVFYEMWPMCTRLADARLLLKLVDSFELIPEAHQPTVLMAAAAIAQRLDRSAAIVDLTRLTEDSFRDEETMTPAKLIDMLWAVQSENIADAYREGLDRPSEETLAGAVVYYARELGLLAEDMLGPHYEDLLGGPAPHLKDGPDLGAPLGPGYDRLVEDRVARDLGIRRALDVRHADLKRHDPCWCGCGRKYKNCHLRADHLGDTG